MVDRSVTGKNSNWKAGAGPASAVVICETTAARLEHLRSMQDENQPSLVRDLIDMFLTDSSHQVQQLNRAHAAADAHLMRGLSHRLLSATQNLGASRLSRLCIELERLAKLGQTDAAGALLADLERERSLAHEALVAVRLRY